VMLGVERTQRVAALRAQARRRHDSAPRNSAGTRAAGSPRRRESSR
jgi:hypothetical protein